eukprot:CAMPEP_0202914022 /NCGR_PEP_ID=MMETSP1392-20130828/62019_1 /ASSEMBLY_ACC=CAM_ASM_000868 /TAXON_ID=225041 /ORGANISM="Chlamydomonas chlamydogama, Strain SAG 11-48b" /LENGTH=431 /DNA_ID=CAMNT_0049605511 /DNA_START=282 /DNA_END=1577 /DNA_ORIENTATION=-
MLALHMGLLDDSVVTTAGPFHWLKSHRRDILVMYIFAASDPEFLDNLRFFIKEAVQQDKLCDYLIVVQKYEGDGVEPAPTFSLPKLPSHARYVYHANECYDWGTFGWLLSGGHVNWQRYKYFFFMNCSVRGPFLPAYARGTVHWTQPFIYRLNDDVKLVGPTISCEGSPLTDEGVGKWRRNPHVQSYAVATDRVGLKLLLEDDKVFQCHDSRWAAIYYSELGSSAAVLSAGYNIDCFMTRYQSVDWRDQANWECNQRFNPMGENYYDGITLDPLEVMFVKVKSFTVMNGISSSRKALKYQQWLHPDLLPTSSTMAELEAPHNSTTGGPSSTSDTNSTSSQHQGHAAGYDLVLSNEYLEDMPRFKIPKILEAKVRGSTCFDFSFYLQHNTDLAQAAVNDSEALWRHFVYFGQFEARPHRFTCPFDYEQIILS